MCFLTRAESTEPSFVKRADPACPIDDGAGREGVAGDADFFAARRDPAAQAS
jgi:hypothetical protein